MKKAIDQTVRDLKRGVNKNVLKVPVIEQKVLDATSNESWGPHGSILADIAMATRNYHEYQIIMSIIWKRINDTGKNWRHVYKGLIVLEYLVAHGSERVIDDIREHVYQISTLSDFQYIDSSGKDQGNNVRRKSQSLVNLVNDKERIQEVREKAAANRDKYRGPPTSGMYRPGSGGFGDRYNDDRHEGRYGSRDDDRNGYGRDREWTSRDDDRYSRDSYGRDGDRYGRDHEERYGRDRYRDDDYNYNSRSRSADRERYHSNEEDSQFSSRGSGAKADDHSHDGRLDPKSSGQVPSEPPSYEDAVNATRSPTYSDRDGDSAVPNASKELSLPGASASNTTAATPTTTPSPAPQPASSQSAGQHNHSDVGGFDEFDPRSSFSAAPATENVTAPLESSAEMDLLGSLSESFPPNALALVPSNPSDTIPEANGSASTNHALTFSAASSVSPLNNQSFNDPFGDGPFKAAPVEGAPIQPQITTPFHSVNTSSSETLEASQPAPKMAAGEFGASYYDANSAPTDPSGFQPPVNTEFSKQRMSIPNPEFDILADILPPPAPTTSFVNGHAAYPLPPSQSVPHSGFSPQIDQSALTEQNASQNNFHAQTEQPAGISNNTTHVSQPSAQYPLHPASAAPQRSQSMPTTFPLQASQSSQMGFHPQGNTKMLNAPQANFYGGYNSQSQGLASAFANPPTSTGHTTYHNAPQMGSAASMTPKLGGPVQGQAQGGNIFGAVSSDPSSIGFAISAPPPSKDKFETKSSVWADTLSRGLVNLNISGPKTNPLADIGVDFDAINRKERRMEKPSISTVTSTVSMGKAMGSGSGLGRAGAGALRGPANPVMMNSGMNMAMAGGAGAGIAMGGYGGSQPMGRGMGMNMNMNMQGNMGMGMNMQQPIGYPSGTGMPGVYNHTMGAGNYGQQPYGGYR